MKRISNALDILSTGILLGVCIAAVVTIVRAIGGRYGMLIGSIPATDKMINDVVAALKQAVPAVITAWAFRVWCLVTQKEINRREEERL